MYLVGRRLDGVEQILKFIEARTPALLHADPGKIVAERNRREVRGDGNLGSGTMIREIHGGQHFDLALALPLAVRVHHVVPFLGMLRHIVFLDDADAGHDFAEGSAHRIIGTVEAAHYQLEFAANTRVHFTNRAGERS